ncbi:MAG: FUSC family protein, partial [Cupriavidus necator]
ALAPDYAGAYQRVPASARRMAALAGVVRAGVESGVFTLPAGAEVRALLTQLDAQLAELAMRPGLAGPAGSAERPALPPAAAFDAFLAEQADYAAAHIAAAHAAVADLRTLGAAASKLPGRRRAHSG